MQDRRNGGQGRRIIWRRDTPRVRNGDNGTRVGDPWSPGCRKGTEAELLVDARRLSYGQSPPPRCAGGNGQIEDPDRLHASSGRSGDVCLTSRQRR